MIVTENYDDTHVRTYSDAGYYIHGGDPEGDYAEAIDPADNVRTYTETDRKIEEPTEDDATIEDYQDALKNLGMEITE